MAINLRLDSWGEAPPDDAWSRTHVGWRPDLGAQQLWDVNRGVWAIGEAVERERIATLSYAKKVVVVVELTGPREPVPWHGATLHALQGHVLTTGHPVHDALMGRDVGIGRNPTYLHTPELDALLKLEAAPVSGPDGSTDSHTARGQGWLLDPAIRKIVEDAAQARLEAHWRDRHWIVTDVRHQKRGYDAHAAKDGAEMFLEAKGTLSAGASVIVSRAEVAFAREHPGQTVMGIWSGMVVTDSGALDPDAGTFVVLDWNPDAGSLTPREFDWFPPTVS